MSRTGEIGNAYDVCQKPEGNIILGKYTLAWEDDIKIGLKFYILKDRMCYPERGGISCRICKHGNESAD